MFCLVDNQPNLLVCLHTSFVEFSSRSLLNGVATAAPSKIRLADEQISCVILSNINETRHEQPLRTSDSFIKETYEAAGVRTVSFTVRHRCVPHKRKRSLFMKERKSPTFCYTNPHTSLRNSPMRNPSPCHGQ